MKKIELVDNKLNVELKPGDIILHKSKLGIAKYKYISIKNNEYLIKRIDITRKNILHFTVSKFWFVRKGTETYLIGDDDIA
jgi:hypothetical protein